MITVYAFLQDDSVFRTDAFEAKAAVDAHRALVNLLEQDAETAVFITVPYRMDQETIEKIQELTRPPVSTTH